MTYPNIRRALATILAAALVVAAVTACGSSSSTSTTTQALAGSGGGATATSAARQKLISCLKAHGVTLPTRRPGTHRRPPSGSGGGGFFGGAGGGFAANPKLRAAFAACGGRSFPRRQFTLSHAAVNRFVACVKQHGYRLPAPNFSGKAPIFPRSLETNAKFRTASRACTSLLRPSGAPGSPGGPPPGSDAGPGGAPSSTTGT